MGWALACVAALTWVVALGQRPLVAGPDPLLVHEVPRQAEQIEPYLDGRESQFGDLVPGAQERVRWTRAVGERTSKVLLVFHGFSASPPELKPLPDQLGDRLDANVVYVRSRGHGRTAEALAQATAAQWLEDAERGLAVAKAVGDQIIVLGNSTGATQALWLLHRHSGDPAVERGVLISPNLGPNNKLAEGVVYPWIGAILTQVMPTREFETHSDAHATYWTSKHSTVAVLAMMDLVQRVRDLPAEQIDRPVLVVINPADHAIDAALAERWLQRIPRAQIRHYTPDAADNQHVLAGDIVNPRGTAPVLALIAQELP